MPIVKNKIVESENKTSAVKCIFWGIAIAATIIIIWGLVTNWKFISNKDSSANNLPTQPSPFIVTF